MREDAIVTDPSPDTDECSHADIEANPPWGRMAVRLHQRDGSALPWDNLTMGGDGSGADDGASERRSGRRPGSTVPGKKEGDPQEGVSFPFK